MEGELVRFRVDASVKDKVTEVCEKLGFDLSDVLRAFMARVAEDGSLPFQMGSSAARDQRAPFTQYSERLWREYQSVDAEVAAALLARFVADRAARIDVAESQQQPDTGVLTQLRKELADARDAAQSFDPTSREAVASVLATYGPLVAALR